MHFTVYGSGAIGGIAGGKLALAGYDVTFVDRVPEHVDRINASGLLLEGISDIPIKAPALLHDDMSATLDVALLCVKAQDTAGAMDVLAPHVGPDTTIVSMQNGLNEHIIAARVGASRTIGCLVNWGGDYIAPGHILYGGEGPMRIGELDGANTERIRNLQTALDNVARTTVTDNIFGYLWSKVIWGCFYIGNALGTSTSVEMLRADSNRPILLGLFREGAAVAQAAGVKLEPLSEHAFDPAALARAPIAESLPRFDAMADGFKDHVKVYSGPWRDIAVRKRPTEVDHIIGPIVRGGERHNVPTPLNNRLYELIREVESGVRQQDDANLLELSPLLE